MNHYFTEAIARLNAAIHALEQVKARRSYTIQEMREIRTTLLGTVRDCIDPIALGHAPEKRHY